MENFSYHVPFYVVTGGVKTSGHSSELSAGAVGLYDRQNFSVATATGSGTEFYFAQGNIGGKDWFGQPVSETHKSPFFFGKDIDNMYLSIPQRLQNEEWVIGFNGSTSSKSLVYETGKAIRVKFLFTGNPSYRFFGGPKEYVVSYTPPVDCSTPCTEPDCPPAIVDCLTHTQALITEINNNVELKKFGVQAKLVNAPFVAGSANMTKYCLTICDNGDVQSLQAVRAQYPTDVVNRTGRAGANSTYEVCRLTTAGAPANFTQTGSVLLAVCGVCPAGTTLTVERDVFFVRRPLAGTEDLSSSAARTTFAGTVALPYLTRTFNGATAVDPTTDQITIPNHGFVAGTPLTYNNGGGTSIVGLTSTSVYYVKTVVDANNFTLSATSGGAQIDITADGVGAAHTLTMAGANSFLSQDGSTAVIRISVPGNAVLNPINTDIVQFSHTELASCAFADPAAVAWASCGTGISSSRTLRINSLNRPDCNTSGDRLTDLTSILNGVQGIQIGTLTKIAGVACVDDYTVQQSSTDCLPEDCLTNNVSFTYQDLPAFEGRSWEVVPPVISEDATRKCGIRITAGYIDPKNGDCTFDITSYYETEPVQFEVSLLQEDGSNCDATKWPTVTQSRLGRISRQSGEYVVREVIMKTDAYIRHIRQWDDNPMMRERFDQNLLGMVDRNSFYRLYYISYRASYGRSFRKNEQERFTTVFAFKESDQAYKSFETNILDVLVSKSGKTIHVNE